MEIQIQDLVESIKKEGIDNANKEAEAIIASAKARADEIVSKAAAEAKSMKDAAVREIDILKESAAAGAQQAKRDAVLSFKAEIQKQYEKLLSENVSSSLKGDALAKLIQTALTGEDVSKYAVELSEVSADLKSKLSEEIKNGLEIRPVKNIKAGFRLAEKDGSGYFDCSDEEITSMLMPYFKDLTL